MSVNTSFFAELQRRHVYKVGAAYAVAGWLLVQAATQVLPVFGISALAQQIIVIAVILGFPVTLVLAWVFDLTPDGIVRTGRLPAGGESPIERQERRGADHRLNYALGALLLLALAYFIAERTVLKPAATPAVTASAGKSIAVLPFENLSDDKANAYFAQGIQDEILTRLAKVGALRVISRSSVASLGAKPDNLAQVAKRLGVDNLLEGSVQKAGDSVHINVQLIHAATEDHLWAETYDRKLDDIFGVEGEVAQAIADALNAHLTGEEHKALDQAPTRNALAYDAYLRGLSYEVRFDGAEGNLQSKRYFQQAVDADPQFALAWAHLSIARSYLYLNGFEHNPQGLADLRRTAETAMKLQPELGEAWLARGYYYYRGLSDFDSAIEAFEQSRRRLPNSAEASAAIAYVQRRQGKFGEAIAHLKAAAQLDPQNVSYWIAIADTETARHDYAAGQAALNHGLEIAPDHHSLRPLQARYDQQRGDLDAAEAVIDALPPEARGSIEVVAVIGLQLFYRGRYAELTTFLQPFLHLPDLESGDALPALYSLLGAASYYGGDQAAARTAFTTAKTLSLKLRASGVDTPNLSCNLGKIEAALGDRDAALEEGRHCVQLGAGDVWESASDQAMQAHIDALLGNREAVLAKLPELVRMTNGVGPGDLRFDPVWNKLRGDPRFEKIVAEVTRDSGVH